MAVRKRPTVIDLFCGCGGLSPGQRRAGLKVIAATDNDRLSVSTCRVNHRRIRVVDDNIGSFGATALVEELGLEPGDLGLLAGCPPCQVLP